jgi:hypothetical protein
MKKKLHLKIGVYEGEVNKKDKAFHEILLLGKSYLPRD